MHVGGGRVTKPRPMDLGHPGSSGGTAERKEGKTATTKYNRCRQLACPASSSSSSSLAYSIPPFVYAGDVGPTDGGGDDGERGGRGEVGLGGIWAEGGWGKRKREKNRESKENSCIDKRTNERTNGRTLLLLNLQLMHQR